MWTTTHLGHWMPLSWMSFGLDFLLWGMEPRGYHLTNLLLHAASAALLTVLVARILALAFGDEAAARPRDLAIAAAIGALTFAVHPLRVESVAWVTERRDVLSGLFALASTWCYLGAATSTDDARGSRQRYAAAIALFAAGLLAKATILTLPGLLLLLEVYPLRRLPGAGGWFGAESFRAAARIAPFAALTLGSAVVSVVALGEVEQLPPLGKLAVSAYSLVFYSLKTIVPTGLAPLYMMPEVVDPLAPRFAGSVLLATALTAGSLVAWRRWPGITVGWLAFVAALFPMLGVRQNGYQIAADRYTYHAAPVLAMLAGAAVFLLLRWRRGPVLVASAVAVAALSAATWRQTSFWSDSESLWRRTVETGNGGWVARNSYGNALMGRGLVAAAEGEFRQAVQLGPQSAEAHNGLGVALSQQGRDREAEPALRRAIELRPDYADAMVNLGIVLSRLGAHTEAIGRFEDALRAQPRNVNAEISYGNALMRLQRPRDAILRYERALALDPSQPQARANLDVARRLLATTPDSVPR